MSEEEVDLEGKLEGLLYLYGEPVSLKRLMGILGVSEAQIKSELESLAESLKAENRGLHIITGGGKVQLTTKPSLKDILKNAVEEEFATGLTSASMETLAIISYLGPCRRSLIEYIRGVNSSFILRSLLVRGLIDREPDPKRKNTYLYSVSFDFLRHMGLSRPEDMPNYEKYRDFVDSLGEGTGQDKGETVGKTNSAAEQNVSGETAE